MSPERAARLLRDNNNLSIGATAIFPYSVFGFEFGFL